jgi:hypothetical protein
MAVLAFASVLAFVIINLQKAGPALQALIPFAVIAVSIIVFFLVSLIQSLERFKFYRKCLLFSGIAALLSIYLAGNYYVVSRPPTTICILTYCLKEFTLDRIYWVLTYLYPGSTIAWYSKKRYLDS